ncbi:MAG TPA: PHP domain-containing protein [Methanomassiliicoccales archaeon]|nr:PHP domain-containing protein [Methanomassiliicoccales archaeon]
MKLDMHVHTVHSNDGKNKVAEAIETLKRKGFQGAMILDHNNPNGALEALALGFEDFIVVPGIEVSSAEGHILALNVTEPIDRDMGVQETIDAIHERGGIAVAAHPYRRWSGLGEDNVTGYPFDAIEAFNGRSTKGANKKASELANRLGRPITGGSDSHESSSLGYAYTIVPDECRTAKDIVAAILMNMSDVDGNHRGKTKTVKYVTKSVTQWLGRGMRRM